MSRTGKFLVFAGAAILLLAAGAVLFGYLIVHRSLPVLEGKLLVKGLRSNVTIDRDDYGVPHIVAADENDLFFAAGYVQAQDRLWQMDFLRRVVHGRLSEVLGKITLDADKALRVVGFARIADAIYDSLDEESRMLYEAYSRGINAYIESHRDNLPVEFTLLGFQPEPWETRHSLAISRLLAWQLSMGWYLDITYSRIADTVGYDKMRELIHRYPSDAPVIVKTGEIGPSAASGQMPGQQVQTKTPAQLTAWFDAMQSVSEMLSTSPWAVGSNNWVISAQKTEDGSAILANDPHLGHGLPSTWYEMHLSGGAYDVIGYALPGLPYIVLGNNRNVAWGFTNVMADETDFYREQTRDSVYYHNGRWMPLKINREVIKIKDSADVVLDIPETHHGPLVNAMFKHLGDDPVSVCWLGNRVSDEGLAIRKINLAANWQELREAARFFAVPAQNMVFMDKGGNIGYQFLGTTAVRNGGDGTTILDGTNAYYDWKGTLAFENRPFAFNPDKGYLASANNKVTDDSYPFFISQYFYEPARIETITGAIEKNNKGSQEDSKRLQNNVHNSLATKVIPLLLDACGEDSLWLVPENHGVQNAYQEALLTLKHWDGSSDIRSRGAAIFHAFWSRLVRQIYFDELGDGLYESFANSYISVPATMQLLYRPESDWWDNKRTPEKQETRNELLRMSLIEAVDFLTKKLGPDPAGWTWGDLHSITFEHPLGKQRPLDYFFNVGPFSHGGDGQTPNKASFKITSGTFKTFEGPSMRRIIRSSDLAHAWSIITVGQSGQPFSEHYKDQVEMWLNGKYRRTTMNPEEWKNYRVLVLTPETK